MRALLALALSVSLVMPAVAQMEPVFRYPLPVAINFPMVEPEAPATAAHRLPDRAVHNGKRSDVNIATAGAIAALYDRSASGSAVNYHGGVEHTPGSQSVTLMWNFPINADGCAVIANVRGVPALAGYRFQHQLADETWSDWTPLTGDFITTLSGNKVWEADCGLPGGEVKIKALRVAPPADQAGEIWYREFRATWHGESAQ